MTSASRGYRDWPSCSKRSTNAWWLKPGGQEPDPVRIGADQVGQEGLGVPDRMAQPEHPGERRALVHRPGQHGHRVAVAEQVGVRADVVHVPGQRGGHRDGPQAAEDPADAQRVADGLAHPVPGRDVEVGPGRVVPADLHLVDHVAGARRAPRAGPGSRSPSRRRRDCSEIRRASRSAWASRSALMSYSERCRLAVELGVAAQVGHHVPGELDTARADKGHLDHSSVVFHCGGLRARARKNLPQRRPAGRPRLRQAVRRRAWVSRLRLVI